MGQKVNPISMRLQVNKDWKSRWFVDKRNFAAYLAKDIELRRMLEKKFAGKGAISKIEIERSPNLVTVNIQTSKAGLVIGKGGAEITGIKTAVEKLYGINARINVDEVKRPELIAKLVAENISNQLARRIAFRRAIKQASAATIRAGAKGIRIEVAGRLNGAEMSRREKEVQGSVPLHTIRANIDYAQVHAQTIAGIIGVKVWIYKEEN